MPDENGQRHAVDTRIILHYFFRFGMFRHKFRHFFTLTLYHLTFSFPGHTIFYICVTVHYFHSYICTLHFLQRRTFHCPIFSIFWIMLLTVPISPCSNCRKPAAFRSAIFTSSAREYVYEKIYPQRSVPDLRSPVPQGRRSPAASGVPDRNHRKRNFPLSPFHPRHHRFHRPQGSPGVSAGFFRNP